MHLYIWGRGRQLSGGFWAQGPHLIHTGARLPSSFHGPHTSQPSRRLRFLSQVSVPILTVSNNLLKIWMPSSPWPGGSGAPPGICYFFVPLGTPFCNAISSPLPVSPERPGKPMPLCHCIPKHPGKWLSSGPSHGARSPGTLLASRVAEPLQGARFSEALHSFFQDSPAFSVTIALSKPP